ncbi:MAG: peptidoglycan DD-metalloendopeptidase family protein [Defluviitaleaceae bacterium]|nr:peptidoglycan DD-metalloendopeptidase family protein [Defluviitaleaceae bacterium]
MLQLPSPKKLRKRARADKRFLNPQSHVQKKYFSLMLVPSYSSGKTRSIRIPYMVFYVIFFTVVAILSVILIFYLQAQLFRQTAELTMVSLEEIREAYYNLQELSEEERRRLTEDSVNLRSALTRERITAQEEQQQQRLTYLETLEAIQAYVAGLEDQLERFEIYRQEILNQLSASSHIPPVRNMLNEMYQSQIHLLTTLQDLSNYSAARRERAEGHDNMMFLSYTADFTSTTAMDAAEDLFSYIALIELTIETKAELYSQLERQVRRITPYIRNYPTLRPVNGRMSSGFGWRRNPMGGSGSEMHNGVDISAPSGTPIRATGGGQVVFAGWDSGGYGNKVIIDHGMGIRTLYAHNSSNLVRQGQLVSRGETIARVGSTGRSTGPHVHYEVIVNGAPVNPTNFFLE